jgi:hypothetical protein
MVGYSRTFGNFDLLTYCPITFVAYFVKRIAGNGTWVSCIAVCCVRVYGAGKYEYWYLCFVSCWDRAGLELRPYGSETLQFW